MHIIHNKNTLTYINFSPVYNGLNVSEFGREYNDSESFQSTLEYRHNHIIHFVIDGSGTFIRDNKEYHLEKGDAFIITPQNLVRYQPDKNSRWGYCWIAFSGTDCQTLFEQCGLQKDLAVFSFDMKDIEPLLTMINTLAKGNPVNKYAFALRTDAMALQVLSNCAMKLTTKKDSNSVMSFSIIDTAVAYMQANLHKNVNISDICRELCVSRAYFSTLFKKTLEQSPYQFLQNLRVQRASELLLADKNLRVYEIAEMVGFSSVAQFCKSFRRHNKFTPSAFRKKYGRLKEK